MKETTIIKGMNNIKLKEYDFIKILYNISFYIISAVLLFSGIAKIINPLPIIKTLKLITIIPASLHIIIAILLPVVEIGLAVLMLMKIKLKITIKAVAFLFALFTLLMFSNIKIAITDEAELAHSNFTIFGVEISLQDNTYAKKTSRYVW